MFFQTIYVYFIISDRVGTNLKLIMETDGDGIDKYLFIQRIE